MRVEQKLVKPIPADFDAQVKRAYFEIETEVNEVQCMATIAAKLLCDADHELAEFAVYRVREMADALKEKYDRLFSEARAA